MAEEINGAEIVLRKAKSGGLVIARVPELTLKEFKEFAEMYFADDYGLCLKTLWDRFKESELFFSDTQIKLNYIINLLENKPEIEEKKPETKQIKMLSGRNVEKELKGGNN